MKLKKTTRHYQIKLTQEEYNRICEVVLLATKYHHDRALDDACTCADNLYLFLYGKEKQ